MNRPCKRNKAARVSNFSGTFSVVPPVEFFVDIPSRQTVIALTTPAHASIGFVKILVQDGEGIAFGRQRMLLNGKELQDTESIRSIGLRDGGLLQLLKNERTRGLLAIDIIVHSLATRGRIPLKVPCSIPVITLKDLLCEKEGTPIDRMVLMFDGIRLKDKHTLAEYDIRNNEIIDLGIQFLGGKPVIYLRSPVQIDASVRLSLIHDWSFSAVYPVVPTKRATGPLHESIVWNVKTHTDGTMTETNTGLDVSYLFWEALTNPSPPMELTPPSTPNAIAPVAIFRPMNCSFNDSDSVVLDVMQITPYLDRTLKALGLDTEARTSFITYWLPNLLNHEHVVLRFVSQASYSGAAPMDITPMPDVVTRVFMVFRKVASDELDLWEGARRRALEDVEFWRDVVGVETPERQGDPTLFQVLEWGGMEVV